MNQSTLRTLFAALFITNMLLLSACAGKHVRMPRMDSIETNEYKLRPGDVLEIKFEYHPEFNQTVLIHDNGTASLRGLGEINVIDTTTEILEILLNEEYSNLLAETKIAIEVKEASKFKIYFSGDVKHPGILNFRGNLSVAQGIILAGGLTDKATDYEVTIFRSSIGTKMKMFNFYLKKHSKIDRAISDFKLAPYDVVVVLKSSAKKNKNSRHI